MLKFQRHPGAQTGGEGGIRTHGKLAPTAVFKTAALNHSATSPIQLIDYATTMGCARRTTNAMGGTPRGG
jgi:hypothetical protein